MHCTQMSAAVRDLIAQDKAGIAVDEIVFPSSQVTFSNDNDFFVCFNVLCSALSIMI